MNSVALGRDGRAWTPLDLVGTATLLRLQIRRERLSLIIWAVALAGTVASTASAIIALYPTEEARARLAASIGANPSFLAITGPVQGTSVGAVTAWRVAVIGGLALGLMSVFTVVRRTRGDEESGRTELLASGVLGRDAPLVAALTLSFSASLIIGVICALGAVASGLGLAGSLALGATLAGPGLVFAAAAAVAAQVFATSRTAAATTAALLGLAFGVRSIGDLWPAAGWLGWLSPLGWTERTAAFAADRWWVVALFPLAAVALSLVAASLSRHRDLGGSMVAPGRVRPDSAGLTSGLALALRLQRGRWIGWAAGFVTLGALTGALADSAGSLLGGNAALQKLMRELGGAGSVSDQLFTVMAGVAGLLAAAAALSAILTISTEETSGRGETVLATGLSRVRWFSGHLVLGLSGSASLLLLAGLAASLVNGVITGQPGRGFATGLQVMAVQIPAVWVIVAVAALILGFVPRLAPAVWVILGLSLLLGQLGGLLSLPRVVMDLSPFSHLPALPAVPMRWLPVVLLLLTAAASIVAALVGLRRRDVG